MPVFDDGRRASPRDPSPTPVNIRNRYEICLAHGSTNKCEGSWQCEEQRPRYDLIRIRRLILITNVSGTMLMLMTTQIKAISLKSTLSYSFGTYQRGCFQASQQIGTNTGSQPRRPSTYQHQPYLQKQLAFSLLRLLVTGDIFRSQRNTTYLSLITHRTPKSDHR
jgi:hypothetical protein